MTTNLPHTETEKRSTGSIEIKSLPLLNNQLSLLPRPLHYNFTFPLYSSIQDIKCSKNLLTLIIIEHVIQVSFMIICFIVDLFMWSLLYIILLIYSLISDCGRAVNTEALASSSTTRFRSIMRIAVEGCMHGELDLVYATLQELERKENVKIDLLICCGDFQAVRNENDLNSLNVKPNYRRMNTFWKYYSGEEIAPFPTIFIGGNHEASNYLWELYYGGWAAPNIYFLGYAGVVKFGNIRIGGSSGIYNPRHYSLGHFERPPYNESDIRSVYHVREYDVHKLMQIEEPIDIFITHDWPLGITDFGNWRKLAMQKRFFEKEIKERTLGSRAAAQLLDKLKPPYWFSAHLHCKFPAVIQHGENGPVTRFLALDKCTPKRQFLQIIEVGSSAGPYEFQYDEEWLAITRSFHSVFPLTRKPAELRGHLSNMQENRQWVRHKLNSRGNKPFDFSRTDPCPGHCRNPQTESFLQFLELPYLLDSSAQADQDLAQSGYDEKAEQFPEYDDVDNIEELALPDDIDD